MMMMMPQTSTTPPRCITFTSTQAPHEVSFCPQSWTTSPPPSRFDIDKNAVLFPNISDGDDKWYVALDSYSLTLRLDLATTPTPALDKEILETTHGIVSITMMDKGYADNIATNTNKYEAVYPNNVLAGTSAHIYDTILHEEAYRKKRTENLWRDHWHTNTHICICQQGVPTTRTIKSTQYFTLSPPNCRL